MTGQRRKTGSAGEALAARHLQAAGYTLVELGWRCVLGEIDLIMQHGAEWVFVEVRTRYDAEPDAPLKSITRRKQARMIRLADVYLAQHDLNDVPYRIDVVAVSLMPDAAPHLEVIENAIGW